MEDLDRIKQQMLNYTLERIWTTEELREQLKVVCTCTCNADHSCSVQVLGCNRRWRGVPRNAFIRCISSVTMNSGFCLVRQRTRWQLELHIR